MDEQNYQIPNLPIANAMPAQQTPEQRIVEISQEAGLSPIQLQAALLDACGVPPKEIAAKFGKGNQYVYQLRQTSPEYKRVVQEFYKVVAAKIVAEVGDIDELFNRQIGPSVATLVEVRDSAFAKDADRLKAATEFLNRASKAPKATQNVESRGISIQIPISAMKDMQMVLGQTGSAEDRALIEMLEGSRGAFEVPEEGGKIEREEEFVEVRRM